VLPLRGTPAVAAKSSQFPGGVGTEVEGEGEGEGEVRGEPELLYREEGHFIGPRHAAPHLEGVCVFMPKCGVSSPLCPLRSTRRGRDLFHTLEFLPQVQGRGDLSGRGGE